MDQQSNVLKEFALTGLRAIELILERVDKETQLQVAQALASEWSLSVCVTGMPATGFDIHLDLVKDAVRQRVATLDRSPVQFH